MTKYNGAKKPKTMITCRQKTASNHRDTRQIAVVRHTELASRHTYRQEDTREIQIKAFHNNDFINTG